MLENAAESHTSGARFVGRDVVQDTLAVKDLPANLTKFYNELGFLPKPKRDNKPKRLLQKMSFANQSQRQTRTQILENLIKPKENIANETDKILQTQFTKAKAEKKTRRFREPTKLTTNKTEAAKQSQSKLTLTKTQTKNLEANFSDSIKWNKTFADEETLTTQKPKLYTAQLTRRLKPIKDESGNGENCNR